MKITTQGHCITNTLAFVVPAAEPALSGVHNKEDKMNLSEKVKEKLAEAVELWADESLIGKPAILANAMFFSLENEMINKIEQINKKVQGEQDDNP